MSMSSQRAAPPGGHAAPLMQSQYAASIARSMTIDEMRELHRHALSEAEAKRTELRLVLASRYRELVNSSDEVIQMRGRAKELDDLVDALPKLVEKLVQCAASVPSAAVTPRGKDDEEGLSETKEKDEERRREDHRILHVRRDLARLPRIVHRCLDKNDVYGSATALVQLFGLIASQTAVFPLANVLAAENHPSSVDHASNDKGPMDTLLFAQVKMVYLHVQTLPSRIVKIAKRLLLQPAGSIPNYRGAQISASALSTLDLLDIHRSKNDDAKRAVQLVDLYYNYKAKLIQKLLAKLSDKDVTATTTTTTTTPPPPSSAAGNSTTSASTAEDILSSIVLILQYDVILYPYQIFVLRRLPTSTTTMTNNSNIDLDVMSTLPHLSDPSLLQSKASHFLAAHLPLIRTKVKTVLMSIAGTTASALGRIRQSLYDKTDGEECMKQLDANGIGTWEDAIHSVVNVRIVSSHHAHGGTAGTTMDKFAISSGTQHQHQQQQQTQPRQTQLQQQQQQLQKKFSLWSALFSNTFSSLVHSILTGSFHSVHARVVSTLRTSLQNAPASFTTILPHEAYRNVLFIACQLDDSFKKVSDDAHELLVHAEEREESERRLHQSLYVQTCEIMGRLLNELRRMLSTTTSKKGNRVEQKVKEEEEEGAEEEEEEATKDLIVGRLCHLLKFRLTSLPTLLDPKSSPALLSVTSSSSSSSAAAAAITSTSSSSAITTSSATSTSGIHKSGGMITLFELQNAFDVADDDDDGLITFEEAMEAMETAFSGTPFHGAEMVRDTLLLTSSSSSSSSSGPSLSEKKEQSMESPSSPTSIATAVVTLNKKNATPRNVTLSELVLLSARGLRHDPTGPESALGTVQRALDDMTRICFEKWSRAALAPSLSSLRMKMEEFVTDSCTLSEEEWTRVYRASPEGDSNTDEAKAKGIVTMKEAADNKDLNNMAGTVSPHITGYLLSVSSILNRSVCPSDSLPPVPSTEYAAALGISCTEEGGYECIPNMVRIIRWSLLREALSSIATTFNSAIKTAKGNDDEYEDGVESDGKKKVRPKWTKCNTPAMVQLMLDVSFVRYCFFERNRRGFGVQKKVAERMIHDEDVDVQMNCVEAAKLTLDQLFDEIYSRLEDEIVIDKSTLMNTIRERNRQLLSVCDLFFTSLFGEDVSMATGSALSSIGDSSSLYGSTLASNLGSTFGGSVDSSSSPDLMLNPLPSTRRFVLLPIQTERTLTEVQLRGKYGTDDKGKVGRSDTGRESAPSSGGAVSSVSGFFSSMLKKK